MQEFRTSLMSYCFSSKRDLARGVARNLAKLRLGSSYKLRFTTTSPYIPVRDDVLSDSNVGACAGCLAV